MNGYRPSKFWENTHAVVNDELVHEGRGIRSVGGGASAIEADYLYRLRRQAFQSALQTARSDVSPCGNLKIFEFGCGSGYWLTQLPELLGHACFSYTGADISPTAIRRLQSNYPDSTFVCLDDINEFLGQIVL